MAFLNRVGSLVKNTVSRHVGAELSAPSPSLFQAIRNMSLSKLFVGGLSYNTDEQTLTDAFAQYGQVVEARVVTDRETGRSRGFAFVTFASTDAATSAMQAYDGKELQGRTLRVNHATEKPRGGGFGSGYGGGGYRSGGYNEGGGGYQSGGYNGGGGGYQSGGYNGGGGGYQSGGYNGGGGNYSGGGGNQQYSSGGGNQYPSGGAGFSGNYSFAQYPSCGGNQYPSGGGDGFGGNDSFPQGGQSGFAPTTEASTGSFGDSNQSGKCGSDAENQYLDKEGSFDEADNFANRSN